jgi:hypothetical protein
MKQSQRDKKTRQRQLRDRFSAILLAILVIAMVVTLTIVVGKRAVVPSNTADYEGVIVDRWADYAESQYGSRPRLALVVESIDGKRFTVAVDPNVYESARVGMTIKNRAGQVVLIDRGSSSNR